MHPDRAAFKEMLGATLPRMALLICVFLGLMLGLGKIALEYNGLKLLMAMSKLPSIVELRLDCFELLQDRRGAFTIFGFPVTFWSTIRIVWAAMIASAAPRRPWPWRCRSSTRCEFHCECGYETSGPQRAALLYWASSRRPNRVPRTRRRMRAFARRV